MNLPKHGWIDFEQRKQTVTKLTFIWDSWVIPTWLDDEGMISEIQREISAWEDIDDVTSELVLIWVQGVEAQRTKQEALAEEANDSDSIGQNTQRHANARHKKQRQVESCKYCRKGHPKKQYSPYSKMCGGCGKTFHFMAVCRLMLRQQQGQKWPRSGRSVHKIRQDEEYHQLEKEQHNRSFHLVNIKYLKFDIVKAIIFMRQESSTSQKGHE